MKLPPARFFTPRFGTASAKAYKQIKLVSGAVEILPIGVEKKQAALCSWITSVALGQLLQQYFRLLQVCGVKPFGEPTVDVGQQLPSFVLLVLLLPQACQAHHRAQFQRLRLLLAGDLYSLPKTRLCFFCLFPVAYSL